jgi:hypothetical protein
MPMAKRTRQHKDEVVDVLFGINPKTFEIESVFCTRDRRLTSTGPVGSLLA